jgi:hypothetical protein
MRITGTLAALIAGLALASAAHAELFRCIGPDGKEIFTDQKHSCPGAESSEPAGVVHRAETPEAPKRDAVPAARSGDSRTSEMEAAAAAQWRQKKLDAEQKLAQIQARREWITTYVSYCSHGAYVTTRDDAGIQQVVNCTELHRELNALESQEASTREYLATGLPDECRKAGCLPGWLR